MSGPVTRPAGGRRIRPRNLRETLRPILRAILAALVTGVADPPEPQEWPAWLRWVRRGPLRRVSFPVAVAAFDLAVALVIFGSTFSVLTTDIKTTHPGYSQNGLLLASFALALPLALRYRHPVAAWRLSIVAVVWTAEQQWMIDVPYIPGGAIVLLLCLYSVAVRSPREVTIGVGAITIAGTALDEETALAGILFALVPLLFGYLVRQRRATREEFEEQERRHRDTEAVLTERQRIARELHDVVAHHMSMIAIQAEAAPYKTPDVPQETRGDLAEIRSTALEALTEMRRILGVLRSEDGSETAPQPGLERLDELVANARGTGLSVDTDVRDAGSLPPGVGLTAYRILQEALSNAMRHAPGSRVRVRVAREGDMLTISVINGPAAGRQARTPGPPGGGHGLVGMRERAGMLGGTLTAGPTPEEGFAVTASLPVKDKR